MRWMLAAGVAAGLAGVLGAGLGAGCSRGGGVLPAVRVAVDGDTAEWPRGVHAVSDGRHVYLRFHPTGTPATLQASGTPTVMLFDLDGDAQTGRVERGVGAELAVELSPQPRGYGARVVMYTADGTGDEIPHASVGFHFAPTYASGAYEARVSVEGLRSLVREELTACRGVVYGGEGAGGRGWEQAFEAAVPGVAAPVAEAAPEAVVPDAPAGCVRVVSWNILRGSPDEQPGAFARVIAALRPDVVLVQEWDGADGAALAGWFNEHAPVAGGSWGAASLPAQGVGVVTWHPIVAAQERALRVAGEWSPRCCAALVRTPAGDVLCASLHLKCCGSAGSDEDERRMREVEAIAGGLHGLFPGATPAAVVVGGDLNLVGSRPPVDVLAAGADTDGGDLAIAEPRVLGDGSAYTWVDARSPFTPGRLDWVLVGDAGASIEGAFVLDAAVLSDAALEAAGIERGDTAVSDHLPVVVDVRVK